MTIGSFGWGAASMCALFGFVWRLSPRGLRAWQAIACVAILATLPGWLGRTTPAAVVAGSAATIVFSGLGIASFDRRARRALRVLIALVAIVVGLIGARTGGLIAIVSAPAGAIGVSGIVGDRRRVPNRAFSIALVAVSLGILGVAIGIESKAPGSRIGAYLIGKGSTLRATPLFDAPLESAMRLLAPWAPLVALCAARETDDPASLGPSLALICSLLVETVQGALLVAPAVSAPLAGPALAASIAMALRTVDRRPQPSMAGIVTVACLAVLAAHSLRLTHTQGTIVRTGLVSALGWCAILYLPTRFLPFTRSTLVLATGLSAGLFLRLR